MRVESAITLIGNIVYKPGWRFEATDHTHRFENAISVRVTYPAHESNRDQAPDGYPLENEPYATFPIMVGDMDDAELYRAITHVIQLIDAHEMREFLRVGPTHWAPFHPHNADGIRRWHATDHICKDWELLAPDMHFGNG